VSSARTAVMTVMRFFMSPSLISLREPAQPEVSQPGPIAH
jgi:hypothetical protein